MLKLKTFPTSATCELQEHYIRYSGTYIENHEEVLTKEAEIALNLLNAICKSQFATVDSDPLFDPKEEFSRSS
jgi:hypothetical protein